ncbi:hypothetical protein Glove_186g70 [Diversispora epigaea]|uniref:Uncharacterized protein n=1 Tax=Diversispora epigaea TaxID=1348612 RepID=A0A397IVC0_9GLOM|nr:hypothetical protein Glove_186g70 [Diversispora epigaea]
MSQELRISRIHIKRCVELSSLQNESSFIHNIRFWHLEFRHSDFEFGWQEQTFAPQTVHFSEKLKNTIPETVDELKTENRKLKEEIVKLKRQNSQIEIDFEKKIKKKSRKYKSNEG